MGRQVLSPGPAASCVRDVSGHMLQTRWAAGHAGSCVRASRSLRWSTRLPFSHLQFEQFTPARPGSCCTPTFHVEHSPRKPLDLRCRGLERIHPRIFAAG
ncbi:hypothetical protein IG631_03052 [Alternaria alternata]|nr:hypothetical protein IG631_03052 [Alternaria alternata]